MTEYESLLFGILMLATACVLYVKGSDISKTPYWAIAWIAYILLMVKGIEFVFTGLQQNGLELKDPSDISVTYFGLSVLFILVSGLVYIHAQRLLLSLHRRHWYYWVVASAFVAILFIFAGFLNYAK